MAARAIWKGTLCLDEVEVPVKLYSAIEDRHVHFRLLHAKDKQPVRQAMVNPENHRVIPYPDTLRAYETGEGARVLLRPEELDDLKPDKSRAIDVLAFLPTRAIDHRWYDRPYYLGPDGSESAYMALTESLETTAKEGLARWVMRNKEYFGALRLFQGYPMLMALRNQEEVVSSAELNPPKGKALDKRELGMARQLIGMLEASFEPEEYHDEYQQSVRELIRKKQQGGSLKRPARRRKKQSGNLATALEASLKQGKGNGR